MPVEDATEGEGTTALPPSHVAEVLKVITPEALAASRSSRAISGESFEATAIAYGLLTKAASVIATKVMEKPRRVLISEEDLESDLSAFLEFRAGVELVKSLAGKVGAEVSDVIPSPEEFVIDPATLAAGVSALLALSSLLRRERSDQHFPLVLDDGVLVMAVREALQRNDFKVPMPGELAHAGIMAWLSDEPPQEGTLRAIGEDLLIHGQALRDLLGKVQKRLKAADAPTSDQDGQREKLVGLKQRLERVIEMVKQLEDALREKVRNLSRGAEAYRHLGEDGLVLRINVVAGGGGTHIENGWRSRPVEHSSGILVSYTLVRADGVLVEAEVLTLHDRVTESDPPASDWQAWLFRDRW